MRDPKECARRISVSEGGCWTHAYDDANDTKIYPGYRLVGNPTVGIGLLLDQSGLATLKKVGVPDPEAVLHGTAEITEEQGLAALQMILPRYEQYAREALNTGIFDTLSPARQCVMVDMAYNMGFGGLNSFVTTLSFIDKAQTAKNAGNVPLAHQYFGNAADHLAKSAYYEQVGNRARRNCAQLRVGTYCSATGDGSDIL